MAKKNLKKGLFSCAAILFYIFALFAHPAHNAQAQSDPQEAILYYNEACGMCADYVKNDLPRQLQGAGINKIDKRDYINGKDIRPEMNRRMKDAGIPLDLQGHIMTFVGDKYIMAGHMPDHIVGEMFNEDNSSRFKRLLVFQDDMGSEAKNYKIFGIPNYADDYMGEPKTYPIGTPISEYLDYLENNKNELKANSNKEAFILPIVLVSGFLDGINPCAFAVLLFFISFLYTLKRTKKDVWKTGVVYIAAIFLAYLAIGLGLVSTVMFINAPHAMAKIGAWLVIILGIINIIGILIPSFPIRLQIPHIAKGTIKEYVHKATLPSAFILGFFVGLCTFPCSGGIYVAIIGLLVSQTTSAIGFGYLILYNIMFVMPLIIILLAMSNKRTLEVFQRWEQSKVPQIKVFGAAVMIALGAIMLIWFT
ncbi:MAG: cytochrome c biogenesis protein CcdA [Candidatus Paceibacterota bacterium]|jgi:cytochrome c biogenesis protein CcdA